MITITKEIYRRYLTGKGTEITAACPQARVGRVVDQIACLNRGRINVCVLCPGNIAGDCPSHDGYVALIQLVKRLSKDS